MLLYFIRILARAFPRRADIKIDARRIVRPIFYNWQSLAQGGEEKGVRMLENVVPQLKELGLKHLRIDHTYDFYDVVSRAGGGSLNFNWDKLDATICDIYATGAKPFLVLGYMPPDLSSDGSVIGAPKNWNEWSLVVQKTIERYSGRSTTLCNGAVSGDLLRDVYYEVWNEPDLETFGKWSIYGGAKDYKTLYFYSSKGATRAQNVYDFALGGPATTAAYRNWMVKFMDYVLANNLRLDFISWHHYTKNPDEFLDDAQRINSWLPEARYGIYKKIMTEYGYDSNPNPVADTNVGAAYTIAAVRNIMNQEIVQAFAFEAKDGPNPSWGILTHDGNKKPRYYAHKLLNILERYQLQVTGEGTFVRAIASYKPGKIAVVLVNYDDANQNTENVPIAFTGLTPGRYKVTTTYLDSTEPIIENIQIIGSEYQRKIIMPPNTVRSFELLEE